MGFATPAQVQGGKRVPREDEKPALPVAGESETMVSCACGKPHGKSAIPSRGKPVSLTATTGYALVTEGVAATGNEWTEISPNATCYPPTRWATTEGQKLLLMRLSWSGF